MNYATIKKNDVANGIGVRVSLFVSGCSHRCKGCFNQEAWDYQYGNRFDQETIQFIIDSLAPSYIKGLSLLGGEPLDPAHQKDILSLITEVKEKYPNKSIWCYTGYLYEDLLSNRVGNSGLAIDILEKIDILVDGKFDEDLKDIRLNFRGSSNQRIIDVQASLSQNKIILWEGM